MPEPTLPTAPAEGDTGALAAWAALDTFHNNFIFPGGARTYLPSDFTAIPAQGETVVTTSRNLTNTDHGKILVVTAAGGVTLTIPSGLMSGFSCVVRSKTAGAVIIAGSGVTLGSFDPANPTIGLSTSRTLAGKHAGASVIGSANTANDYWLEGAFA